MEFHIIFINKTTIGITFKESYFFKLFISQSNCYWDVQLVVDYIVGFPKLSCCVPLDLCTVTNEILTPALLFLSVLN